MDYQFPAEQVARGRDLVRADREARLELGELLLDAAPWTAADDRPGAAAGDPRIAAFAVAIGLSAPQARRYRKVAWLLRRDGRDVFAESGVTVSYAALSAALLRSGGSVELLLDVCRVAAADGRAEVSVADVEAARRAVVKAAATERRLRRASEQADRTRREQQERHRALAPYRDGIESLVAARVADGAEPGAAEAAVVTDLTEQVVRAGGNPADLLELGSEVIDRHADLVTAARRGAAELRSVTNQLSSAEHALRRLTDQAARTGSDEIVQQWLAALDRIITHAVDLAERLRERTDAAQ
jgi:hypothetical protein